MRTLLRFEPLHNAYIIMADGEYYVVEKENINEILSEFNDFLVVNNGKNPSGIYSMPLKVQIQATKRCNLKCITCAVASCKKGQKELTTEEMKNLLKLLAQHGILNIEWSGGEPFLRKNFLELVQFSANLGLSQNILTNGTLFNGENCAVARDNFFRTQISLDGVKEVYDKIVGRNIWRNFSQGVKLAVNSGIKNIVAATVLQKNNFDKIRDVMNFCINLKIGRLRISMQLPIGRTGKMSWKEYSQIINLFRKDWPFLKDHALNKGLVVDCFLEKTECADEKVSDVGFLVSPGGYSFLYIDAFGEIYPFPFLTGDKLKLGSIKKDDLSTIWLNSRVLKKLRAQTYKNTGCGNCRLECSFAERSSVFAYTGRLDGRALPHSECRKRR